MDWVIGIIVALGAVSLPTWVATQNLAKYPVFAWTSFLVVLAISAACIIWWLAIGQAQIHLASGVSELDMPSAASELFDFVDTLDALKPNLLPILVFVHLLGLYLWTLPDLVRFVKQDSN